MDLKELLEPVYPDEGPRKAWPFVLGCVAVFVVLAVGAFAVFGGSDDPAPVAAPTEVSTSMADDGAVVEATQLVETTVTTTTLDPNATMPDEAKEAILAYLEVKDDAELTEAFFSEIEKYVYFITVLRKPEEIARYEGRHAPHTDNYVVSDGVPTEAGSVLFEVDYTYDTNPVYMLWEIAMADGKVTLFSAVGR